MFARKLLFTAPFDDDWDGFAQGILESAVAVTGLSPVILLPDDIQLEEYEPRYEVVHADRAVMALSEFTEPGAPPRLLFCDFSPTLWPDDMGLLPAVNEVLRQGWSSKSVLVVCTPNVEALHLGGTDTELLRAESSSLLSK